MIVKSVWTTLASTGAVSVALAATLTFNGALSRAGTSGHESRINADHDASAASDTTRNTMLAHDGDTLAARVSLAEAADVGVVVIDAGHGGHDLGCQGTEHGALEKVIALEMALGLAERLRERHPDVQVVLTRERDVFVPLHERARVANRAQADLLISLHCNALPSAPKIRGSETYVMGLHTAQHNLDVAKRENAAIHLEADGHGDHYDFDPDSPAGHITLSMFQHASLEQSMQLASGIEDALGAREGHRSRGVKQAGFLVLKETAMPSVLVETGYLTNPTEEAYLNGHDGQVATVEALYRGVETYMQNRRLQLREGRPVLAAYAAAPELLASAAPGPPADYVPAPGSPPTEPQLLLTTISEPGRALEAHVASPMPAPDREPSPSRPVVVAPAANSTPEPTPVEDHADAGLQVFVQLLASAKTLATSGSEWTRLGQPIRVRREGDYLKYQAGPFATVPEAEAFKRAARAGDFPDAFTIGYREGVKLTRRELQGMGTGHVAP